MMGVQEICLVFLCADFARTSPVKSVTPNYPGKVIVKMGMFPRIPQPEMETFADHRHDWQGTHEGVTQFKIKMGGEKFEG